MRLTHLPFHNTWALITTVDFTIIIVVNLTPSEWFKIKVHNWLYLHLPSLCPEWTTSASSYALSSLSCTAIPRWRGTPPLVRYDQCRTLRRHDEPCDPFQGTQPPYPFAVENESYKNFVVNMKITLTKHMWPVGHKSQYSMGLLLREFFNKILRLQNVLFSEVSLVLATFQVLKLKEKVHP